MQKEIRERNQDEQIYFQNELPEEIVRELTPELLKQYYLWDEIAKREAQLHPRFLLPVLEEVFHKKFPQNVRMELLSTEYAISRIHKNGEKLLQSIYSDLVIKVGKELYHLECQMKETGDMVLRMMEYDIHIALTHGNEEMERENFTLNMPKSVILYLGNSKCTSEYEECTICFQDGGTYAYRVPVMRVQKYTTDMIGEKHLYMLIPFLPIRFRNAMNSKVEENRRKAQNDLTELLQECIIILNHEKENGILTEIERSDITEFLSCACEHLYGGNAEVMKEVHKIMKPIVWLRREMEQWNQELEKDIRNLEKTNTDLQKDKQNLEKTNTDLQKDKQDLQKQMENGVKHLIYKLQEEGASRDKTINTVEEFFSLTTSEAEEKVKRYWKE